MRFTASFHLVKRTLPERDWLFSGNRQSLAILPFYSPPSPISGPIESHHDPGEPLGNFYFCDEGRWSEEIMAWGREHSLLIEPDEE